MIRLSVQASDLARVLANALAFIPAASPIQMARIRFTNERISALGTDGYAAGSDWAELDSSEGIGEEPISILIAKAQLTELEGKARKDGKKFPAVMTLDGYDLKLDVSGEYVNAFHVEHDHNEHLYETLEGILAYCEGRPPLIPGTVCLDPALLSRFAKVKADKSERKADFLMTDAYEPVLIKIGPTFKGLIMPIDREVHGKNVGEEGLW